MTQVTVRLPAVLTQLVSCDRNVEVSGRTVGDALQDLVRQQPALSLHLFDDGGSLRRLVLCFCNQDGVRDARDLGRELKPGDTITIVNSVAGG